MKWVKGSFPYLVFLMLSITYFSPVIISTIFRNSGNMVIMGLDLLQVNGLDRIHFIDALKKGIIPWWNPYIHNGLTFHALANGQFFYPFSLLHLIMPVLSAFTVNYILHVFLAGVGMFLFIRTLKLSSISAFISGLIFMFCSYVPTYIYSGHFVQLDTLVWVPWYFFAFEKAITTLERKSYRYIMLGAIFIALSLLAGHWQFIVMGGGALMFYALFNSVWSWMDGRRFRDYIKPAGFFLIFIIVGIVISAVQVIPTLVDMNLTIRSAGMTSYDVVAGYPFKIMDIITFIAPFFYSDIHWEDAGYMGILPLFLAFYALIISVSNRNRKRIVFFLFLAIFSLFLSFGNQSPFYAIYYFFKPLRTFRVPARFITIWMFSLSVLAGFGMEGLLRCLSDRKRTFIYVLSMASFFILLILSGQIYKTNNNLMEIKYMPIIFIVLSALNVISYTIFYNHHKIFKFLICFSMLVIILDLFSYRKKPSGFSHLCNFDMTQRLNGEEWYLKPMKDVIANEKDVYPYYRVNWAEQPILNMTYYPLSMNGIFLYDGPWNCPLTRVYEVQELAVNSGGVFSPIYDLFGVRYVWLKEELDKKEDSRYQKAAENIFINTSALPRAFMVYKYKVLYNKEAIFQELRRPDFVPNEVAILEKDLSFDMSEVPIVNTSKVDIVKYDFNSVILYVATENPGILVLADAYHPGWKVYIDGKKTKVFPVDWAVRGVYLPKGQHQVKFYFFPWYYKLGIAISILTLVALIIGLKKCF